MRISDKAFMAESFDGTSDVIPESQIFGRDFDVDKSDAYWISEWILGKKSVQYSYKKSAWFDSDTRLMLPTYTFERHKPEKREVLDSNFINDLKR